MNPIYHIAIRYFFSLRKKNVVNIITAVSIMGVLFGSMAMIIVLSVFNGFDNIIQNLYKNIDSDFKIELKQGDYFNANDSLISKIKSIKGVINCSEVLEYQMLVQHEDNQMVTGVKGVGVNYLNVTNLHKEIFLGNSFGTHSNFVIVKDKLFYGLSLKLLDFESPIQLSFFSNKNTHMLDIHNQIITKSFYVSGVFKAPGGIQKGEILLNIDDLQEFVNLSDKWSSIEIDVDNSVSLRSIQNQLIVICGDKYDVKNRFQQRPFINKIIQSEKLVVYIIFSFILILSMLSLIASLVVLLMQKQRDIEILHSLGFSFNRIKKIFLMVGLMITSSGLILGSILGLLFCVLQDKFQIFKLGNSTDYLINYYPIKINEFDILLIGLMVLLLGFVTTYFISYQSKFYKH